MSACIGLAQQDSVLPVPQQDARVIGDQSAEDLRRLTLGGPRPTALSVPPREEVLLIGQERQIGEILQRRRMAAPFQVAHEEGRRSADGPDVVQRHADILLRGPPVQRELRRHGRQRPIFCKRALAGNGDYCAL
jgi:hypothetical protein